MQHILTLSKFDNKTQLKCIRTNFMYLLGIENKNSSRSFCYNSLHCIYLKLDNNDSVRICEKHCKLNEIASNMIWDQYIIENKYV